MKASISRATLHPGDIVSAARQASRKYQERRRYLRHAANPRKFDCVEKPPLKAPPGALPAAWQHRTTR
jgi:hypothetical protein